MAPIAVNTTEIEWSPAERFVSGSARQYAVATRPSVDVQSVPSFTAASNQANAGIPFIKENSQNQETENRCLTVWEVPVKEVADVLRHRSLNTSLIYAKLDTPRLAGVALPWPGSAI